MFNCRGFDFIVDPASREPRIEFQTIGSVSSGDSNLGLKAQHQKEARIPLRQRSLREFPWTKQPAMRVSKFAARCSAKPVLTRSICVG